MTQKLTERSNKKSGKISPVTMMMDELFMAIQNKVSLSEDDIVVEVVNVLFRTGQVKYAAK